MIHIGKGKFVSDDSVRVGNYMQHINYILTVQIIENRFKCEQKTILHPTNTMHTISPVLHPKRFHRTDDKKHIVPVDIPELV